MPLDATNLPFPRPVLRHDVLVPITQDGDVTQLRAENILLEEFTHASVTAYQANQERTDLLNLYLIMAGVIATAVGISVSAALTRNLMGPLDAVIVGLIFASVLSFGFFVRLIHLGRKYHDALLTMDLIKEFYIQELREKMPHLQRAFRWRVDTLPESGHSSGTTLFIGTVIALMGSFSLGAAAELLFHYSNAFGGLIPIKLSLGPVSVTGLLVDIPVFLVALLIHTIYYRTARRHLRLRAPNREVTGP